MSVTINGIRGTSAYSGDLSGSLLTPTVVGIQNIPVSTTFPQDGEGLFYNAAAGQYIPAAGGVGGGTGSVGPQGPAGPKGDTGATGATGPQGPSGSQGPQGIQGPSGSVGATGATGPQGEMGPSGSQGPQGDTGATGPSGSAGPQGPQGIQGPAGATGATGPQGPQGIQGPSGSQGPQGIQGLKGDTGATGPSGSVGPQGETGPVGPSGSAGPQGQQGIQGPSGSAGANGATGPQGPSGSVGATGATGPQGPKGDTGATGPQGPSGTPANLSAYATIASPSVTNLTASSAYISNNLSVAGNLTVNGTMTSVNSTNLEISDKYILIASGAVDAAALDGAGIQFGSVPSEDARIIYDAVNDEMEIYPAARSAEFRGSFSGSGASLTSIPASSVVGAATTGSNTFVGNQVVSGTNNAFFITSSTAVTAATLSTYPFKLQQYAVSAGTASYRGIAISADYSTAKIEALGATGALGGNLTINSTGLGSTYLYGNLYHYGTTYFYNTSTYLLYNGYAGYTSGYKFVVGASSTAYADTLGKLQVVATSAASGAILIPTGSITMYNGNLSVTGSIYSSATISGSAISGSFAGAGAGITGIVSSSYATNAGTAQTASYIATASYATNAGTATTLSGFNATNPSFTSVTASYFTGSHLGDGSSLTGIPYDVAGEVTGSIVSGSELLNYLSPRAFTMQAFSQYTGSGAASAYVMKNSVSSSFPASVSVNDLITVISTTTGSKAYFTIKGSL